MSAFPILSRFQQDAHIKTVEIDPSQTMDEVAATCAFHSIDLHVADKPGRTLRVRPTTDDDSAQPWPRDLTVEKAGSASTTVSTSISKGLRPRPFAHVVE